PLMNIMRSALSAMLITSLLAACGDDNENPTPSPVGDTTSDGTSDQSENDMGIDSSEDVGADIGADVSSDQVLTEDLTNSDTASDASELMTIAEIVASNDDFESLLGAVVAAELDDELDDESASLTVFAPTDAAFAALGTDPTTLSNLEDILLYHVLDGEADSTAVLASSTHTTLEGSRIVVTGNVSDGVFINDAQLDLSMIDIQASNGIIHVIDAVLVPPTQNILEIVAASAAAEEPEFTVLAALVAAVDLADVDADPVADLLSGELELTAFAPTDAAFEALAEALDALQEGEEGGNFPAEPTTQDIVDELTESLEPEQVLPVLAYHVAAGVFASPDVTVPDGVTVESVSGVPLYIDGGINFGVDFSGESPEVLTAQFAATDIIATNGLVHVVDAVLLPPDIPETAFLRGGFDVLVGALQALELPQGEETATLLELVSRPFPELDEGDPLSIFAPTDVAFQRFASVAGVTDPTEDLEQFVTDLGGPEGIIPVLAYHVIPGLASAEAVAEQGVVISGPIYGGEDGFGAPVGAYPVDGGLSVGANEEDAIPVAVADIGLSSGYMHILEEGILVPPGNLVEVAMASGDFDILVDAVVYTNLGETLSTEGPLTVFAPTDAAFEAFLDSIEAGDWESDAQGDGIDWSGDLSLDTEDVEDLLIYHLLEDMVPASDAIALAEDETEVFTAAGAAVTLSLDNGDLLVNEATVVVPDVLSINAIIHVINGVLTYND
ncbi:MAG: fasciclin domain-containing protein, partial [Myxococcales bacterium]|nr:fasciclin domain-containing protein [Myxococcales bacterium]